METIKPGKYIVAVSGGVDSAVLLDMLQRRYQDYQFIVAHYDHGIREHSSRDRELVQKMAEFYKLPFVYEEGHLGPEASEELARNKRYEFLYRVKDEYEADGIITAHHQGDVLETIIINLLRGTGRKGLSSLQSNDQLIRPLLDVPKESLIKMAESLDLQWNEDESNTDQTYLRNWVRHNVIPMLSSEQRAELLRKQKLALKNNQTIDRLLDAYLDTGDPSVLDKRDITQLPHAVALELIAHWLRSNDIRDVDSKMLERITLGAKTLKPGKTISVKGSAIVKVAAQKIQLFKQ